MTNKKTRESLSFARTLVIACISACISSSVFGIADGRTGCWQNEIRYTAMHGTEDQLLAEIDRIANNWYSSIEKLSSKKLLGIFPKRKSSTKPDIKRLRSIFVNLWEGCPGKLIDYSVAAGNIPNTNLLLSLGADPAGRSIADETDAVLAAVLSEANSATSPYRMRFRSNGNIFRRCIDAQEVGYLSSSRRHYKNESLLVDQSARATLFRRLIRLTDLSEITARDNFMHSALTTCDDPYILKLLIEEISGSGMDCFSRTGTGNCQSPLDNRTLDYMHHSYSKSHRARRLELLKLVAAAHPTKTLDRVIEINVCNACRRSTKDPSVCGELKDVINVRHPATLLPQSEYKPNLDPIQEVQLCYELIK